ncbi:MAG: multidrug efflux RND transporter permease subunit [Methylovirgula sp.]|nr:multidrug efflux RND transporter permease subunit [Methylovirgula sp.]
MISKFFIERPILANVIAILTMVIGAVSLLRLPVSQYPDITPPTIQVTTTYPGASAKTLVETVAQPIEEQVNGVENMIYMQSTSASDGTYTLTVTFKIGTDINFAQILVQNRVASALASLPQAVQAQGVVVQKRSTAVLLFVTLYSPDSRYNSLYLANYATIHLQDELARVPGVGNVNIFGAGQYAMRLWLDPNKLYARALTTQDVINAVQQQNEQVTAGQLGMPPVKAGQAFQYTLNVAGRLDDVHQFENIIVKTGSNGAVTRIRDIGRVELGAQTYSQSFYLDRQPAAGIAIYQLPGANALDVEQAVEAKMKLLAKDFPQGLTYAVPFDTTTFVQASVHEVYKTLFEAGILVLIVILVFLQDWRAMLVPATTVPVTIIGAFAAMAAMGFSINLSTLFAIILAIGIVVDDAIVVVEGAAHHIEAGLTPHDAAIRAMQQLLGPIIGITLVLLSVFLPAAFLPGLTGRMYAQFALVIAATALISAVNAVTLKPTQAALWLRAPKPPDQRNILARGFNNAYARAEAGYMWIIRHLTAHSGATVVVGLLIVVAAIYGIAQIPTGFLPLEDQGYFIAAVQLPDGASLERTEAAMKNVSDVLSKVEGVEHVITVSGVSVLDNSASLANAGVAYIILTPWDARGSKLGLLPMYMHLNAALSKLQEARITVVPPPPIQGVGNAGGFTFQLELKDGSFDLVKLQSITHAVVSAANGQSALQRASSPFRASVPQLAIDVDRTKAESLHVTVQQVFDTLTSYLGSTYINQFNKFGRTFQVYTQADSQFRVRPADVETLPVRNANGTMIPLGTIVHFQSDVGASLISLYNLYPSSTIIGMPAAGYSSGQAMNLMEQIANRELPRGTGYDWTAMSYQEKIVGGQMYLAFGLALLLVYFVLAGQYESWLLPLAVILAVPLSLVGPVSVFTALRIDNNLYVQIGLVLLIALSAKNAILIVEFARDLHLEGHDIIESAREAARARFRPILMTSFAFILGVAPLVVAQGAGANARKSIGITVSTGMLASTCLAVLFVPAFYVIVQKIQDRRKAKAQKPAATTPAA